MIVTIARIADPDRFLRAFETVGAAKRREHGCRGAWVYIDPDDMRLVWPVADWDHEDYDGLLADPGVAAIAQEVGIRTPPVYADAAAEDGSAVIASVLVGFL